MVKALALIDSVSANGGTMTLTFDLNVAILDPDWADTAEAASGTFVIETSVDIALGTSPVRFAKLIAGAAARAVNTAIGTNSCVWTDVLVPGWGDHKFPPAPEKSMILYQGEEFLPSNVPAQINQVSPIKKVQGTLRITTQEETKLSCIIKFNGTPNLPGNIRYALYGLDIDGANGDNLNLREGMWLTTFGTTLTGQRLISPNVSLNTGPLVNKDRYHFFLALLRTNNNRVDPTRLGYIERVTIRLS